MLENFLPEIVWIIFVVFAVMQRVVKNKNQKPNPVQTRRSSDEFVTSTFESQPQSSPLFPHASVQPQKTVAKPFEVNNKLDSGFNKKVFKPDTKIMPIGVVNSPPPQHTISLEQQAVLNGIIFSMILAPRKFEHKQRDYTKM